MKKIKIQFLNFVVTILGVAIIGCGSSKPAPPPATHIPDNLPTQAQASNPQTPLDVPEWFMSAPTEDEEYIYATAEGTSRQLNLSIQKATQQARTNLGQQISTKVQSLVEQMVQEAGMGNNNQITEFYSEASRSVSNETLNGATVIKKYPYQTADGGYRTYILMGLKKKAFRSAAVNVIKNEEAMFAEFKKTQAFDRLSKALEETK